MPHDLALLPLPYLLAAGYARRVIVHRVITPLSPAELAETLGAAHVAALGVPPPRERLGVAWAQVMLETGRGAKVNSNNFGNITAGSDWSGDVFELHVPPPDPPSLLFRAYPSPIEGAADYWRRLSTRYADALAFFDAGDPRRAAAALRAQRYFTARLEPYALGMCLLYREFATSSALALPDCPAVPPPLPVVGLLALFLPAAALAALERSGLIPPGWLG